jgi:hypothetical protein
MNINSKVRWSKPIQIKKLILECVELAGDDPTVWPPETASVYIVTHKEWHGEDQQPTTANKPAYVGSNSKNPKLFRRRVGDLIADLFGFCGEKLGHHAGAMRMHRHFRQLKIPPHDLYIAWAVKLDCTKCLERGLIQTFKKEENDPTKFFNKSVPSICKEPGHQVNS